MHSEYFKILNKIQQKYKMQDKVNQINTETAKFAKERNFKYKLEKYQNTK